MAGSVLEPTRSRAVMVVAFVAVTALLWIARPASAAYECSSQYQAPDPPGRLWEPRVEPPDGQYPGGSITIFGNQEGLNHLVFRFNDERLATTPNPADAFWFKTPLPDVPSGEYRITIDSVWGSTGKAHCWLDYTVLAVMAVVPGPSTGATVPLDTIDTTTPTATTTTTTTTTSTTTTTPPPTTPLPTTAAPTTVSSTTPAPTAAPAQSATVAPATSAPTTVAPTTAAAETSTTAPEPTSTVPDTTVVAAAPLPDDGGTSSNGMLIGLLIGLGVAALVISAWALGRRGRHAPTHHQQPPPPPPPG